MLMWLWLKTAFALFSIFSLFDSNSWDEHVFELVLPKACMVGHVDFKFVLNSNITNIPQIQVTLLKNKAPGLGKVNGKNESNLYLKNLVLGFFKKTFQIGCSGLPACPALPRAVLPLHNIFPLYFWCFYVHKLIPEHFSAFQ